jgi:hypothetical protein
VYSHDGRKAFRRARGRTSIAPLVRVLMVEDESLWPWELPGG